MKIKEFLEEVSELNINIQNSELNKTIFGIFSYRILSEKFEKEVDNYIIENNLATKWGYAEEGIIPRYGKDILGYELEDLDYFVDNDIGYFIAQHSLYNEILNPTFRMTNYDDKLYYNEEYTITERLIRAFDEFQSNWLGVDGLVINDDEILKNKTLKKRDIFQNINLFLFEEEKLEKLLYLINDIDLDVTDDKKMFDTINDLIMELSKKYEEFGKTCTPLYITKLISKIILAEKKENLNIYDPALGIGSLLINIYHTIVEGFEIKSSFSQNYNKSKEFSIKLTGNENNTMTFQEAEINRTLNNVPIHDFQINYKDTLKQENNNEKYNVIVSELPFNMKHFLKEEDITKDNRFKEYAIPKKSNSEFLFIEDMISKMSEHSIITTIVPPSFLFVEGNERNIRKDLIKQNIIDTIIKLPQNSLYYTSISPYLIIFKNYGRNNKLGKHVLFINASKEYEKNGKFNIISEEEIEKILKCYLERKEIDNFSKNININEIIQNDYNLNMNLYLNDYEIENIEIKESFAKLNDIRKKIDANTKDIEKYFIKIGIKPPI